MTFKVAVIGGGLAGITAAIALAESGADVTLLEARPRLGGATCSFSRDGLTVDTGQHIFLGCCTAYRGLLAKLGMTEHATLQDRFDVTVLAPGGRGGVAPPESAELPEPTASRVRPGSAGPRSPARCICCRPWGGIRFFLLPNGCRLAARPSACASSTRPTRRWTRSDSATGSPGGVRASGPAGRCGTCSRSRR